MTNQHQSKPTNAAQTSGSEFFALESAADLVASLLADAWQQDAAHDDGNEEDADDCPICSGGRRPYAPRD
jgi:hypothetical protein